MTRTFFHLFKVHWNDYLMSKFSVMHRCGINTDLTFLTYSLAEI